MNLELALTTARRISVQGETGWRQCRDNPGNALGVKCFENDASVAKFWDLLKVRRALDLIGV